MPRPRLVCLILALVTVVLYLPVRQHAFLVYDDTDYVTDNKTVQSGLTWAGVKWAFTTFQASNWHPLTWLSLMFDCELFGPDPAALHLVNVLFHIANTVTLFVLLFRLTGALWPVAFVSALFAWHPLHVESVAWIAERKDVLSTFFGLLTLLMYFRYVKEKRRGCLWFAYLFFALSLLAKPMLVTLPFVMLLLDWWPLERIPRSKFQVSSLLRFAMEKWLFFAFSAASCVVTFLAQRGEAVAPLAQLSLKPRLANAVVSYVQYLVKTLWPVDLILPYPLTIPIPWTQITGAILILLAIYALVWRARIRSPWLLVGWLWYLGTLVPVIGLVQVGGQAMADRYSYFPLVGVFIAVTWACRDLLIRLRVNVALPTVTACVVLAGCLAVTRHQLQFWRDSESLFTHTLAVTKDNAIAHINLGVLFEHEGRDEGALIHYREAARLAPHIAAVHNNLANLLDKMGKTDDALNQYQEALKLKPDAPLAHLNLGASLIKLGRHDEAFQHYTEAARLAPGDPRPHYLMGKALLLQGNSTDAVTHFRDALQVDSNDIKTLAHLARTLASDENSTVRNGAEAMALAERANTLVGDNQSYLLDTLAMAYAEAGKFDAAKQTIEKAIALAIEAHETNAVAEMQERLQLYQTKQPYRESQQTSGRLVSPDGTLKIP